MWTAASTADSKAL